MEPLIITAGDEPAGEDGAVVEMEPLVITGRGGAGEAPGQTDGVIEMEPLTITAGGDEGDAGQAEGEAGSPLDGLGLPLYLKGLLDDLLKQPETGEAAATQPAPAADDAGAGSAETESLDTTPEETSGPGDAEVEPGPEAGGDLSGAALDGAGAAEEGAPAGQEAAAGEEAAAPVEPTDADPDAALREWQGGVRAAGGAIPAPSLGAAGTAHTAIAGAGQARGAAHAARRGQVSQSARAAVPPAPQVESPPAPPATNPIPEYTQRILDASSGPQRRLAQRALPALVTRPGGTAPRAGQTPVDPRIFQLLMSPERLAQVPDTEAGRQDRELVERARRAFSAPLQVAATEGAPQQVPIDDAGAPPIPPLPPQMATPVGEVVVRLLAQPDEAAGRVSRALRRGAYPNDILNDRTLQSVGQALLPAVRTEMTAELRRVALAAGLTAERLDGMVQARQVELEEERRQASLATAGATRSAASSVSQEGGRTLGTIAQARRDMDEEALRRQEAAGGGTDPTVIEARRAQVASWVRERVTTEITNFQRQGDARQEALDGGLRAQENAYNWAAQRDEYQVLNVPTPASQRPPEEQQRLQDQVAEIRNFARERIEAVRTQANAWKESDAETIRGWRTAMETAGTEAIQAARRWADERIDQGRSWWERIVNRITGWRERAQEQAIQWEVRTTTETRNMIAGDLAYINQLDAEVTAGATRESLLANQRLTAEQRAVINAYFATGARRNPLDIVAERLEARLVQQQQPNANRTLEQELLSPGTDWHVLNLVGAAQRGGFDASVVAGAVHDAVAGWGTNEAKIYSNLAGLTNIQVEAVRRNYRERYGETIDEALSDDLSDDELRRAQLMLEGDQRAADAYALHYAVDQWGTDEETIMSVLRNQTPDQRRRIIEYYNQNFDPDLDVALRGDMGGHELDRALALSQGNIAEADAIALDEAMRGGLLWGAGTDEGQIEATYQNIRSEVLAQAQREGWTSAQMEAEVRRRNREVEQAFNTRYANVEEYRAPDGNGTGSVLQRAFRSELSGPELDLANALNANDLARADAARIEIERQSVVYADDEKINNTLRGQYERALEGVRLDQGPERRHQMQLALREWTESHPNATANELSAEQIRLERRDGPGAGAGGRGPVRASPCRISNRSTATSTAAATCG